MNGKPANDAEIETIVEVPDDLTSEWLKEHAWKAKWPRVTEQH